MKYLRNPVKGAILLNYPTGNIYQIFGVNVELYRKAIGTEGHNGVDIVKEFRAPILASAGKVVERKDDPSGYGRWVRLLTEPDENGDFLELTYGHLDGIYANIQKGFKVEDDQIIGLMGNTGFVISGNTPYWGNAPAGKGVHLHFGVRECSTKNTGHRVVYASGDSAYVKDYNNGLKGATNPLKYIEADPGAIRIAMGIIGTIISLLKKMQESLKVEVK